jgi:GNAT superfamily N-acetyltransferase
VAQVRPAGIGDLDRVRDVRYAAFSLHAPDAYSPQEVENLLSDLDEAELAEMIGQRQLFVAVADGEIHGVAGWRGVNLRHVYVAPGAERTGIGSQLVAHAERDFENRTGESELHVGVVLYAKGFYEANGYKVLGMDTAWDGSAFFRMIKVLSSSNT